ncbi:sn-glycerol-1-phosphate dehydrogenase [Pectinatus haikarae]|uniref:sn-glycerol-1-phosphate dehydrogenase n=1 Tax=Pectinatus haikarae TaxID=349096 RepID=UPI0018C66E53|nr:sn-glycerol-1-phosphate dehydrogenase [Pectinatus haikarae]
MVNWNEHLNKKISCACGRDHECDIAHVEIGQDVIEKLAGYVGEKQYKSICIVADKNTIKVAGEKVYKALKNAKADYSEFIFQDDELVPNELNIGRIFTHIPYDCDFIIAVGSGVINDLIRFVSQKLKCPYVIVATAPSMDGYASAVSPLIVDDMKVTYEKLGFPWAVIGDVDILKNAPEHMITAGTGDVFGKYVCLVEWKLAHIVNDEYYCPSIVDIMYNAVNKTAEAADNGIAQRDKDAIISVMEGLVWAGTGISYCGNSRPASGCEHQIAHFWEMMFLQQGHHELLHGTLVGIATVAALHIYKEALAILEKETDFVKKSFDKAAWESKIKEVYGPAANGVLKLENEVGKNCDDKSAQRMKSVLAHKAEIIDLIKTLPDVDVMINRMKKIHEPYLPQHVGISHELLRNALIYAKELRNRYGVLQLLFDCGKLEVVADKVCAQLEELN